MRENPQPKRVSWTDEHLLIALNLYTKIPFGRFHSTNPVIVAVAAKMGRTPDSLGMKLCNLASLDPVLRASGRKGLEGASTKDRKMWAAFQGSPEEFGPTSEQLLQKLMGADETKEVELLNGGEKLVVRTLRQSAPEGPSEALRSVRVRRGQSFFRGAVLTAYDRICCITGIPDERLLEAAHIKSWSAAPEHRHNPRNGLCLSRLHHAAFDEGLITLDDSLRVMVSSELRERASLPVIAESFLRYEGKPISRAQQNAEPNPAFLAWHRDEKFLR